MWALEPQQILGKMVLIGVIFQTLFTHFFISNSWMQFEPASCLIFQQALREIFANFPFFRYILQKRLYYIEIANLP